MGLLNGDIQALFGNVFGGLYLDATIYRANRTTDDAGNVSDAETSESCKVQIEDLTERMIEQGDFNVGDRAIIILTEGVSAPPVKDDEIEVDGGARWKIASPITETDPAGSYWIARAAAL